MKRGAKGEIVFSPSDLITYMASPFASWMERYHLEFPGRLSPDEDSEEGKLIAEAGNQHELEVLEELRQVHPDIAEIDRTDPVLARQATHLALERRAPVIYQAALADSRFAGYSDFLLLGSDGYYQVWDTKLAYSPRPYYAVQLCAYAAMLDAQVPGQVSEAIGVILGTKDRVEFRIEDFRYYYGCLRQSFLKLQDSFDGDFAHRPIPGPRADHGRWSSPAERFFLESDHLVQVAGISIGQIKKLERAGISTVQALAESAGEVPKMDNGTLQNLRDQARLQCATRDRRRKDRDARPVYEVLSAEGPNGEPKGFACLPREHPADVFFDMEGYPLVIGGLEYLFGAETLDGQFHDWWAHDRGQEKTAFEGFVRWVYERWRQHPGMHVYHYAPYEVSAVRRLSTRHNTMQDEVDTLLRNEVFLDLYRIVQKGLRIGEDSYSIKRVERLYRGKRAGDVVSAVDSIVQYARWMASKEPGDWRQSAVLKGIRDYNRDDCVSMVELVDWLRSVAKEHGIPPAPSREIVEGPSIKEDVVARTETEAQLRKRGQDDKLAIVLADLIDFHRREEKPIWWRLFDRAQMLPNERREDAGCIEGIVRVGEPRREKQSLVQDYRFDPTQECKLSASDKAHIFFAHDVDLKAGLVALDREAGTLRLKISVKTLADKFGGEFPKTACLIEDEIVPARPIPTALSEVAALRLSHQLPSVSHALLSRRPPVVLASVYSEETTIRRAIRVALAMDGDVLIVQGPPGTGKTYTASRVIAELLQAGKRVGIASNGHKAVMNLVRACGAALEERGEKLTGIKVKGDPADELFDRYPDFRYVEESGDAFSAYRDGIAGATAWVFCRGEWQNSLDYLFIDEAGQVSLANAVAMSRCARNLVLLGDQMQLEQPIQGSHPGLAGLSALQYALLDHERSKEDAPIFHAVVPESLGLFLPESRRMHPDVCHFISESVYEGRLRSVDECGVQRIAVPSSADLVRKECGILLSPVEHEGNTLRSEEEVERVVAIFQEMLGRNYTDKRGETRPLEVPDFLFVAPYNAQVRSLREALPDGARVGSVDKFQGQEAPVCILSLCSSFGEYGSRGLSFILDRNRMNVAISRAQCMAIVVADPRIATASVSSIDEMRLVNLFCKIVCAN